jgi:hypothetical protein
MPKWQKWYYKEFQSLGRISFKKGGNYCQPNDSVNPYDEANVQCNCDFSIDWFGGIRTSGDYS